MFKEDLTFLPPASLPAGFPHASHSLPHSLPSLAFCAPSNCSVLIVPRVFLFFLHHIGLQVGGDGGEGRGRRACAGGTEVGGDTGSAAAGSQAPQQHPHRAGGAHQPVVSDSLRSLTTYGVESPPVLGYLIKWLLETAPVLPLSTFRDALLPTSCAYILYICIDFNPYADL